MINRRTLLLGSSGLAVAGTAPAQTPGRAHGGLALPDVASASGARHGIEPGTWALARLPAST